MPSMLDVISDTYQGSGVMTGGLLHLAITMRLWMRRGPRRWRTCLANFHLVGGVLFG